MKCLFKLYKFVQTLQVIFTAKETIFTGKQLSPSNQFITSSLIARCRQYIFVYFELPCNSLTKRMQEVFYFHKINIQPRIHCKNCTFYDMK